jgi:hypothetical protein
VPKGGGRFCITRCKRLNSMSVGSRALHSRRQSRTEDPTIGSVPISSADVVRTEPEQLRRVGAVAAFMYGLTLLLALVLITPPFLSGPADALEPSNAEARVRLVAGLSWESRTLLQVGFPLEFLNIPLLVIALVALWESLAGSGLGRRTVALVASLLSAVFLLIGHFQRFLLLTLADRYLASDETHRAGLGAAAVLGESVSQTADMAFNVLLGTGLAFFALALTRVAVARWFVWLTWVASGLSLISAVLSAIDWRLGFLSLPALFLFLLWTLGVGVILWRGSASDRLRVANKGGV